MAGSIYAYALISALYDEGQDYIDSLWPLTVKVMPSGKLVVSSLIQKELKRRFNFDVPLHVLEVILTRAVRRNYVRTERDVATGITKYKLTNAGLRYSTKLETDREVERRINALLDSIRDFFLEKGVSLSLNQIRGLLLYFLQKNIDFLVERINPQVNLNVRKPPKFKGNDRYLLAYVKSADQKDPRNYKILQDMIMGSIISVLFYVKKPEEITEITTRKFTHCQVFLDTNFIFSILDLHTEEFNEPAKELLDLLKRYDFDLKVFGFTIDEISRVINSYPRESYRYPINIRVDTLYSNLKRKGWTKIDSRRFIINIEQILYQQGIMVEWTKHIDLNSFAPDEQLKGAMKKYKPEQDAFHQNHDLAAISKISELRGKPMRRIEDSKAFFLTSDARLNRFNFIELGHEENGTICETILDRLLTNILWLKNPSTKLPLKSIIAAHSRGLFVNRRVWERFYEVLRNLKAEGKIKDDDILTLFWHSYIEDALRSIEETEMDKISPQFVLNEIENAEKLRRETTESKIKEIEKAKEVEMETKLREKEREFSEALERSISEAELRKEKEWLNKIHGIKESLRERSNVEAASRSNIYTLLLALAVIAVVVVTYFLIPIELLNLALTVVGGGGLFGLWKFRGIIRNWLFERTYRKKTREAELDKVQ